MPNRSLERTVSQLLDLGKGQAELDLVEVVEGSFDGEIPLNVDPFREMVPDSSWPDVKLPQTAP